jgi:hypothetical protein
LPSVIIQCNHNDQNEEAVLGQRWPGGLLRDWPRTGGNLAWISDPVNGSSHGQIANFKGLADPARRLPLPHRNVPNDYLSRNRPISTEWFK